MRNFSAAKLWHLKNSIRRKTAFAVSISFATGTLRRGYTQEEDRLERNKSQQIGKVKDEGMRRQTLNGTGYTCKREFYRKWSNLCPRESYLPFTSLCPHVRYTAPVNPSPSFVGAISGSFSLDWSNWRHCNRNCKCRERVRASSSALQKQAKVSFGRMC